MTEKCLIGNPQHDLSGTLFTRCFWYTIVSVLTDLPRDRLKMVVKLFVEADVSHQNWSEEVRADVGMGHPKESLPGA